MKIILSVFTLILLSSCQVPDSLSQGMTMLKQVLGISSPEEKVGTQDIPEVKPEAALKANAELLSEMMRVIFGINEVDDQPQFESLLSTLQQGASIEGVYRGLVMGTRYRNLETRAKSASPKAVKYFALEMAEIQYGMKNPTRFDKNTAKLFPSIEMPDGIPDQIDLTPTPVQSDEPRSQQMIAEEILQVFIGATPFTLKRVLSEEFLKKMDEVKTSPEDVALWFAGAVIRSNQSGYDFGLELRNKKEFEFHHRFAKQVSAERLKWEILNRYHRILNQLN